VVTHLNGILRGDAWSLGVYGVYIVIEFHVGVYRSYISRTSEPDATQIAYYDEIRHAETCEKLNLKDLDYSCKKIENQR